MRFINDRYKKVRGGYSRLLEISCEKCGEIICTYQKDGPGDLRRMYLDRIFEPSISTSKKILTCSKGHVLGLRIIWAKEKRVAYRIFVGALKKQIIKAKS